MDGPKRNPKALERGGTGAGGSAFPPERLAEHVLERLLDRTPMFEQLRRCTRLGLSTVFGIIEQNTGHI